MEHGGTCWYPHTAHHLPSPIPLGACAIGRSSRTTGPVLAAVGLQRPVSTFRAQATSLLTPHVPMLAPTPLPGPTTAVRLAGYQKVLALNYCNSLGQFNNYSWP